LARFRPDAVAQVVVDSPKSAVSRFFEDEARGELGEGDRETCW